MTKTTPPEPSEERLRAHIERLNRDNVHDLNRQLIEAGDNANQRMIDIADMGWIRLMNRCDKFRDLRRK